MADSSSVGLEDAASVQACAGHPWTCTNQHNKFRALSGVGDDGRGQPIYVLAESSDGRCITIVCEWSEAFAPWKKLRRSFFFLRGRGSGRADVHFVYTGCNGLVISDGGILGVVVD